MLASRWVVEKIQKLFTDKDRRDNLKEMKTIFGRYPDDMDLQKIRKDALAYFRGPSPSRLKEISKNLEQLHNSRKLESSGGTRLWFGDRRVKGKQETR